MNPRQIQTVCRFEGSLKVGDKVVVRWTSSSRRFVGSAIVRKINEKSIKVALTEEVKIYSIYGNSFYPVGRVITVPLFATSTLGRWSANNSVSPVDGYNLESLEAAVGGSSMKKVYVINQEYSGDHEIAIAASLKLAVEWVKELVEEYEIGPITHEEVGKDTAYLEAGPDVNFLIEEKELIS